MRMRAIRHRLPRLRAHYQREVYPMLGTILLVFALVLSVIATFWPYPAPTPIWNRFNPLAAAIAFYFASLLFHG